MGGLADPAFTDTVFGQIFSCDSNTPQESVQILERLGCWIVIGEFMNLPDGGRDKGRYAIVAEKTHALRS